MNNTRKIDSKSLIQKNKHLISSLKETENLIVFKVNSFTGKRRDTHKKAWFELERDTRNKKKNGSFFINYYVYQNE